MASFSLVAPAWNSTSVKVGLSVCAFSSLSAVVKGFSALKSRSQRPMSTITATVKGPQSTI